MTGNEDVSAIADWFVERFWPEHLVMHRQALTILQLISGEKSEPPGFVSGLVDPQPILQELSRVPGALDNDLRLKMRAYMLAWGRIRDVAVSGTRLTSGQDQFNIMVECKAYFDDIVMKSLRNPTNWLQ